MFDDVKSACVFIGLDYRRHIRKVAAYTLISFILAGLLFYLTNELLFLLLPAFVFYHLFYEPKRRFMRQVLKSQNTTLFISMLISVYFRMTRNLERAISFAAKSMEGLMSDVLKVVVWDVVNKRSTSIVSSIEKYKDKIKEIDPNFLTVIEMLASSLKEKDTHSFNRLVEKAFTYHITVVEERMKEFVRSIVNPVKLLFTFLVLFPLLIIVLIPTASIFLSTKITLTHIVILFNVLLPISVVVFTDNIIYKRPPTTVSFYEIPLGKVDVKKAGFMFALVIVSLLIIAYFREPYISPIGISLAVLFSSLIGVYALKPSMEMFSKLKEIELNLPSFLSELSASLSVGSSMENAVMWLAKKSKELGNNALTSDFMPYVIRKIRVGGKSFSSIVSSKDFFNKFPSKIFFEVMNIVGIAAEKGAVYSSEVSSQAGKFLSMIADLNDKLNSMLEDTISTLDMITTFILPLVSAVSLSFALVIIAYLKMFGGANSSIFSFTTVGIDPFGLSLSITLYVFETVFALSYLLTVLKYGESRTMLLSTLFDKLVKSSLVYLVSFVLSFVLLTVLMGGVGVNVGGVETLRGI